MKAAVYERYGPPEVVKIIDVPKPEPGLDEILIKSFATTVNSGDSRLRARRVPRGFSVLLRIKLGWSKPKQPILGLDVSGKVEAVGNNVTGFKAGDRVIASRGFDFGCHAEYVMVAEGGAIAAIPDGLSYEDAVSLCFGGTTSAVFFDLAKLKSGETILINGASGAVGAAAVQLAKHRGAIVTAVCSTPNIELMKSLGADTVIDYTTQDFTQNDNQYDLIMDNHGNAPYRRIKSSLAPGGRFLLVIGDLFQTLGATLSKSVISPSPSQSGLTAERLVELMALANTGAIRPVIDSVLPFERIVEAHRRVDGDHKVGSVVLQMNI